MVYTVVALVVLLAFCVLAVDVGRVQLAKSQLQQAADAAARYAATGVVSSATPDTTARQHAAALLADCTVDGGTIAPASTTVTTGTWDEGDRNFTPNTMNPNAARVELAYNFSASGRPPLFARSLAQGGGRDTTIYATSIAVAEIGRMELFAPASGNLWLSAAEAGTRNQNFRPDAPHVWDYAGSESASRQSPQRFDLSLLNVRPGDALSFEGVSGSAQWVENGAFNGADGDTGYIVSLGRTRPPSVPTNSYNGMSNTRAPIGAVMAVFLSDDPPSNGAAPAALDFNTATQRDYATLRPALKQVFFVGDGKRANGEVQRIVVPEGATRVFVGMMDAWQWNDNVGTFKFNVYGRKSVVTVR